VVEGDLNKGGKTPVRLWVSRSGESPIAFLKIVTDETTSVGAGFGRYPQVLNADAKDTDTKLFLCYQTLAALAKIASGIRQVGDLMDVMDPTPPKMWRVMHFFFLLLNP